VNRTENTNNFSELKTPAAPPKPCCSRGEQATCCEPSAKAGCCGPQAETAQQAPSSCGCR
jgi:hypothetical protein